MKAPLVQSKFQVGPGGRAGTERSTRKKMFGNILSGVLLCSAVVWIMAHSSLQKNSAERDGPASLNLRVKRKEISWSQLFDSSVEQVSLSAEGPSKTGKWTYIVRYATNSSEPLPKTLCRAWTETQHGNHMLEGVGETPRTYSNLQGDGVYTNPDDFYTSPYLHSCRIKNVEPSTVYKYAVGITGNIEDPSATFSFLSPPLPSREATFTFAVMADVGQTEFSNATFFSAKKLWEKHHFSTLVFPGDLSYSDGDQYRWDSFGKLAVQLFANVEILTTPGNHEVEHQEAFLGYQMRYNPGELWSVAQRGPVTFISLNSYSRFEQGTAQYRWLEATLRGVDRSVTPWLIVQFHAPIYTSNKSHRGESEKFRHHMEPLFRQYSVDILFSGHVHAYERTVAMYNSKADPCGSISIVIGDGGNREGPSSQWDEVQPNWSGFREASFGFGYLTIDSPIVARWTWVRNPYPEYAFQDTPGVHDSPEHDTVKIDRSACASRLK